MTREELDSILKAYSFPQMMLTRNLRTQVAAAISSKTSGFYNHFCWLISPTRVASQDMMFREVLLDDYLSDHYAVKFVTDLRWTHEMKVRLLVDMNRDLERPWYKRLYDPLAIFGQWSGMKWIQIPWCDICSDKAKYLRTYDPNFNIQYPNPTDINVFQKEWRAMPENDMLGYWVTARWLPGDL